MKTITRYSPVTGKTITGRDYAYMREDESGFYIAMHDHYSEMESLLDRIREFESKQNESISIRAIISEHADQAVRDAFIKTVEKMFKPEFK